MLTHNASPLRLLPGGTYTGLRWPREAPRDAPHVPHYPASTNLLKKRCAASSGHSETLQPAIATSSLSSSLPLC